jgi:CRP/FNR family transcriptional regulator, cyclic AMP receptor protein
MPQPDDPLDIPIAVSAASPTNAHDERVETLATAGVLRDICTQDLRRLTLLGRRRLFAPGDVLMRQDESSDCLHVLIRGRVRVERMEPQSAAPLLVAELGPCETVGEMGLLNDAPRSATVTALEETETLELDAHAVSAILAEFPEVATELLRVVSARLRGTTVLSALRIVHATLLRERAEVAQREEAARLHGVLLAARTMEHHANNQLALVVGYGELLAADPRLPEELRDWARKAAEGAVAAAETVRKFRHIAEVRPVTTMDGSGIIHLD